MAGAGGDGRTPPALNGNGNPVATRSDGAASEFWNNKPWVAFVGGVRHELPETAYTDGEVRAIREQEAARQQEMPVTELLAHPVADRTGSAAPSAGAEEFASTVDGSRPVWHGWYDHWSDADASRVADANVVRTTRSGWRTTGRGRGVRPSETWPMPSGA